MATTPKTGKEHLAVARALSLPISTKQCVELSTNLRYRTTSYAKKFLQDVLVKKRAVVFRRFTQDLGHKPGIGPGRYPQKAAQEFLKLINSVEANAQFKGLDTSKLKIVKIVANKASIPFTGSRLRRNSKSSHLEVEVQEMSEKGEKKQEKRKVGKAAEHKAAEKTAAPSASAAEKPATVKPAATSTATPAAMKTAPAPAPTPVHAHTPISTPSSTQVHSSTPVHQSSASPAFVHQTTGQSPLHPSPSTVSAPTMKEHLKEPSSEELLKKAQERAAQLNKKQVEQKDVNDVSHLYDELQKKGTLRSKK